MMVSLRPDLIYFLYTIIFLLLNNYEIPSENCCEVSTFPSVDSVKDMLHFWKSSPPPNNPRTFCLNYFPKSLFTMVGHICKAIWSVSFLHYPKRSPKLVRIHIYEYIYLYLPLALRLYGRVSWPLLGGYKGVSY